MRRVPREFVNLKQGTNQGIAVSQVYFTLYIIKESFHRQILAFELQTIDLLPGESCRARVQKKNTKKNKSEFSNLKSVPLLMILGSEPGPSSMTSSPLSKTLAAAVFIFPACCERQPNVRVGGAQLSLLCETRGAPLPTPMGKSSLSP